MALVIVALGHKPSAILNYQFSIINSQLSILNSLLISIHSFQLALRVLGFQALAFVVIVLASC